MSIIEGAPEDARVPRRLSVRVFNNFAEDKTEYDFSTLVQDYTIKTASNNSLYVTGTLSANDGTINFKSFDTGTVSAFETSNFRGKVIATRGSLNVYNGSRSMNIKGADETQGIDPTLYQQLKYDKNEQMSLFLGKYAEVLSESGKLIFNSLLSPVHAEFELEYAARAGGKNHDNVMSGLLAHSRKCLDLTDAVWSIYPELENQVDKDLLYIGIGLHDIGKVHEYSNGIMSETGLLVSHRTIACEMLARKKTKVVEAKGIEWYYRLMSIFAQHHGEYEEKPRTVEAFVAHLVDNMEASMTGLLQTAEAERKKGESFRHHGFFLS